MNDTDYYFDEKNVEKMSDDEIISTYQKLTAEHDTYISKRSDYANLNLFGTKIITPQSNQRKKEYAKKYKNYSNCLTHNLRLIEKEMMQRKLTLRWWENIEDDPLDSWYFQRKGKKELLIIIDYLNNTEKLNIKRSGTINEIRRRLKDYIPKNKRKEVISKILTETEDAEQ